VDLQRWWSRLREVSVPGTLLVVNDRTFEGVELSVPFLLVARGTGFRMTTLGAASASILSGLTGLGMLQTHPLPPMR
jgi:hypothetical protein